MSIENKLGDKIKKMRKSLGLTQEQLAEKIGIDDKHLSKIENNKHQPAYATLCKISQVLGNIEDESEKPSAKGFSENNPIFLKSLKILNSAKNDTEREYYLQGLKLIQKALREKI